MRIFNEQEKNKVNHFFFRMKNIYGEKYMRQYPDDLDEQGAKREWADIILSFSDDEIDKAFKNAILQKSNAEKDFQWPDPGMILSGAKRYANASHRQYLPPPEPIEPDKDIVEKNIKALKNLLNEVEK